MRHLVFVLVPIIQTGILTAFSGTTAVPSQSQVGLPVEIAADPDPMEGYTGTLEAFANAYKPKPL